MGSFFGAVQTLFICGTVLMLAFLWAVNQPASPARDLAMKALTIAGCLLYVISPIDVLPEVILGPLGLLDDAVAAWVAAKNGYRLYTQTAAGKN